MFPSILSEKYKKVYTETDAKKRLKAVEAKKQRIKAARSKHYKKALELNALLKDFLIELQNSSSEEKEDEGISRSEVLVHKSYKEFVKIVHSLKGQ